MDYDQILEMVKRVRKSCAEELKGKQHKIDVNKNGKLDAQDFEHLRKMKSEEVEDVEESFANDFLAMAKQKNPNARISTADQRKKEADELAKKRAGLKPASAGPSGNARPLGGYDPKSNRSYSEEVELDEEQLDELTTDTLNRYVKKREGQTGYVGAKKGVHQSNMINLARKKIQQAPGSTDGSRYVGSQYAKYAPGHEPARVAATVKKEDVDLDEELKGAMHPDAPSILKHIKPEHHGIYKPFLKKGVYQGGYKDRSAVLSAAEKAGHVNEDVDLDEAKAPSGSPFSKDYKSQMPDDQKTSTKTYHDVKKTSTGTVYTKQSDPEGYSKGTGDDAAKEAEPKVKRGRGRPVGSKSGARQAGSASTTDYRGFVTHTLNLPASK